MSEVKQVLVSEFQPPHVSLRSYVVGFITCIVLTLLAYVAAISDDISDRGAIAIISVLAITQCVVQLRRFLHLGSEFKPRWKLAIFIIMLCLGFILVAGSLWIMDNLNYRMMHTPRQESEYVRGQDGL